MINIKMQSKEVHKLSPKIIVIGIGGAGGNAVNNMISSNLEGCEFLVCNTDAQALEHSLSENKLQLGVNVTGGLGAGSKPEIGRAAAEESLEDIMKYLDGANMAFVTAGMGGGTGTGAAPVIAKACREKGILTVGVVTKPFHFEGAHRMKMAEAGLEEMQDYVDTLIVIPNQNLFRVANEKTTFAQAFQLADSVLQAGVRGVTDLMVRPGLVNLDFADIRTAMLEMGKAMMGTGEAEGEKRALEAAEAAINNPLLDDVSMKGAHGVIINISGGYDMTLYEADEVCDRIRNEVDPDANIIFGATFDEALEGKMRVSIVATGIDRDGEVLRRSGKDDVSISATPVGGNNKPTGGIDFQSGYKVAEVQNSQSQQYNPASVVQKGAPPSSFKALQSAAVQTNTLARPSVQDQESDMFDHARYSDAAENGELPHNTAMRGTRFKDSFIPPLPAQPEFYEGAQAVVADQTSSRSAASVSYSTLVKSGEVNRSSTAGTSAALTLNPPRQPVGTNEKRKTPSLFERITGTVQQTIEGAIGSVRDESVTRRSTPSFHEQQQTQRQDLSAASQGMLNIDAPAAKPLAHGKEEELDIPAFLRRQAN
ncbi:MAG: cell division protein FtsZ [Alphaproteobacteria bacterium]